MLLGLLAGVHNLPFLPILGFQGTDYMKIRPDLKTVRDPYSGHEYVVVPPIRPDVALIHGRRGERQGGVVTLGARTDRLLAMAAKKTIAQVEELVDADELRPERDEVYIAGIHIDAVVVAPGGAHPTACPGRYPIDERHLEEYITAAKDEAAFRAYVERYIIGPQDQETYLRLTGFLPYGGNDPSL